MEYDENDDYILVPEEDLEVLDKAYEIFKERNADLLDFEDKFLQKSFGGENTPKIFCDSDGVNQWYL